MKAGLATAVTFNAEPAPFSGKGIGSNIFKPSLFGFGDHQFAVFIMNIYHMPDSEAIVVQSLAAQADGRKQNITPVLIAGGQNAYCKQSFALL